MTKHYVIWWTNQCDAEMVNAIYEAEYLATDLPPRFSLDWPEYLHDQWESRYGRAGRGRLWNAFPEDFPNGVDPWPTYRYAEMIGGSHDRHSAAGIVIPLEDLHHVIGLPGFVTNDQLSRLCINGVDVDL